MASKDPITCHVLDTTTGRPASQLIVSLRTASSDDGEHTFDSETNEDGRIMKWTSSTKEGNVQSTIEELIGAGSNIWKLSFRTGDYYGHGKTFWPTVELTFYVNKGEHYHVPLLLGPYSYTTYRGS